MEAGMRSPGSSPLVSPKEKIIVQRALWRSFLKKIVHGVLFQSLLSTNSAESVFHIPGGIDPLGGSQRDAEEGFFQAIVESAVSATCKCNRCNFF